MEKVGVEFRNRMIAGCRWRRWKEDEGVDVKRLQDRAGAKKGDDEATSRDGSEREDGGFASAGGGAMDESPAGLDSWA